MDYFILPVGFTPSLTNLVNGTLSATLPTGAVSWMSGAVFGILNVRDASGKITTTDVSDQEFNYSHTDPNYFMMRLKTSGDVGGRKTLSVFPDGAYIKMKNGAIFRKVGSTAYQIPGGSLDKKNFIRGSYTPVGKPARTAYIQVTDTSHVVYEDLATFASGIMIPDSNGADYFCFWAGYWVASTLVSGRKCTVMSTDGTVTLVDNVSAIDGKVVLPDGAMMVQFARMGCCLLKDGNLVPYLPDPSKPLPNGLKLVSDDSGKFQTLQLGACPIPVISTATGPFLNPNLTPKANQKTVTNGIKTFTDEYGMSSTITTSPIKKVCGNASYAVGITNGLVDFLNVMPTPQSLGTPFIYVTNTNRSYTLAADGSSKPAVEVVVGSRKTLADDSLSKATKIALPDGKYDGFSVKRMRITRDTTPAAAPPATPPQVVPPADASPSDTDSSPDPPSSKKKHYIIITMFILLFLVVLVGMLVVSKKRQQKVREQAAKEAQALPQR
jgi:hypothetical protein